MTSWRSTLAALFEEHRRHLVALATRRVRDSEVAAELVQDVYARLIETPQHRGGETDVKTLYASLRNAVIDHRRRASTRDQALCGVLPFQIGIAETMPPEGQVQARQAVSALDRALMEVTPRAREMFILHRLEGVSNAKLAERYGISVSAVEKQLARVMRHCQDRLALHRDDVR
ncbi:RNA polymerase sigma factor [Azospirillum sp. ST 5-10]|uniref:RNA polymerase sigma factor n=1 Tax=unclassified Azospirillum TaxID=2630922 RepID=UPI003F4A477C